MVVQTLKLALPSVGCIGLERGCHRFFLTLCRHLGRSALRARALPKSGRVVLPLPGVAGYLENGRPVSVRNAPADRLKTDPASHGPMIISSGSYC